MINFADDYFALTVCAVGFLLSAEVVGCCCRERLAVCSLLGFVPCSAAFAECLFVFALKE